MIRNLSALVLGFAFAQSVQAGPVIRLTPTQAPSQSSIAVPPRVAPISPAISVPRTGERVHLPSVTLTPASILLGKIETAVKGKPDPARKP